MPNLDIVRRRTTARLPNIFPKKLVQRSSSWRSWSWPKLNLPRIPWKIVLLAGSVIVLVLASLFVYLPSATVTVKARSEPLARDFEIRVDQNQQEVSIADLAIPARIIEQEVAGEKKIATTGSRNVGKNASGFISIYNFSKTTLVLKAQTTELTANGHKYYFTQDVGSIRPTARIGLEDQEIDESSLVPPIPVVAASPGEEFNLPSGTRIEVSNEVFGAQPQLLYAVAAQDITGGSTKLVKLVTQTDIDNAFKSLGAELDAQARTTVSGQNPDLAISENAVTTQTLEQQAELAPGREAEEFNVKMRSKFRALAYAQSDARKIIFERLRRLLPETKTLSEEKAAVDFALSNVDLNLGVGLLHAHVEGSVVFKLDHDELVEKIRGKSAEEIREIFLSKPEIESLEIEFSPFWVKSSPKFKGRITLDVL